MYPDAWLREGLLTAKKMGKEEFGAISLRHTDFLATIWKFLAGSFTANGFESAEAKGIFPQVQKRW